jgi:hypothetical protein
MSQPKPPKTEPPVADRVKPAATAAVPSNHRRRFSPRKLLVASIGVATVRYALACTPGGETLTATSGNLVAPPFLNDAGPRAGADASSTPEPRDGGRGRPDATVQDAGADDDAGDGDGGEADGE